MNLKKKEYDKLIKGRKNSPAYQSTPGTKVESIQALGHTRNLTKPSIKKLSNSELRKSVPDLKCIKKFNEDSNLSLPRLSQAPPMT